LVILFLLSAFVSITGIVGTFQTWTWLHLYVPVTVPLYNIFKGTFLALAWLIAAVTLWLRFHWSLFFGSTISILSSAWFWLDRIGLTRNSLPFNRYLLLMAVNLILLVFILFSLVLLEPFTHPLPKQDNPSTHLPTGGKDDQTNS
jgi:hypothetical protein